MPVYGMQDGWVGDEPELDFYEREAKDMMYERDCDDDFFE